MKQNFTAADVDRWVSVNRRSVAAHDDAIERGQIRRGYEWSGRSRSFEALALAAVASGDYSEARDNLAEAARSWRDLLRCADSNGDVERELIRRSTNGLFLAVGSFDEQTIVGIAGAHAAAGRQDEYGVTLRALLMRDEKTAKEWLPPLEKTAGGHPAVDVLSAIVTRDATKLQRCISESADYWKDRVRSEKLQVYPDAVFDLYGMCKVALAFRLWGSIPDVDLSLGCIPSELFP